MVIKQFMNMGNVQAAYLSEGFLNTEALTPPCCLIMKRM